VYYGAVFKVKKEILVEEDAMNIRPASIAVTIMFGVLLTPVAFAQTIAFNKNIMCGNERIAIESCFDDSDNAGCMVIYPDRPLHNGFTVQEVEKRGDVIKKIKGCMGPNATLASTGHPAPSAAPASAPASAAAKPNAPPPPPDPSVAKAHAAGVDTTALGLHLGEAFRVCVATTNRNHKLCDANYRITRYCGGGTKNLSSHTDSLACRSARTDSQRWEHFWVAHRRQSQFIRALPAEPTRTAQFHGASIFLRASAPRGSRNRVSGRSWSRMD
jgi:hypothetical protein